MPQSPRVLRPRSTGFTPKSITGLALWLDASDSSTLFQDATATTPATATNDPVGAWLDKSGNGRHLLQPASSLRPVVGTQGARRSLSLNGTSQWLRQERTNYRMRTQFLVWRRAGTPALFSSPFGANGSIDATLGGAAYASSDAHSLTYSVSSTGSHYWSSNIAANRPSLVRYQGAAVDPTALNTFGQGAFVAPDTSVVNVVYTDFPTASTGNKAFYAGVEPYNAARLYPAQLLEVLQYTESLTASQVRQVERYLAAKWGITLAPQVSNADAQDWINRVYANGGSVTSSTAAAVNTFCDAIDAAAIRDRFYRLNLFCGTGLNACLVPLYRGPSLSGTQYGGTTDTNASSLFVTGDYVERGSGGGLQGSTASTKRLRTGLAANTMPDGNLHLAAYEIAKSNAASDTSVGARSNTSAMYSELQMTTSTTDYGFTNVQTTFSRANDSGYTQAGAMMLGTAMGGALSIYRNGSVAGTATAAVVPSMASQYAIFSTENESGSGADYTNARLGGYSIGLSMSASQVANYYTAMQAFQTALTRNV